ncbi:MAG: AtpZ/AtpI family protein [Rhodospirillales bacterium]
MSEREEPGSLQDLDARLRKLQAQERRPDPKDGESGRSGLGLAMRIGVEIVAALIVGAGIGILLDRWLGTSPWLLVAFFILGAAAGMLNVYRTVSGMGGSVGYKPADGEVKAARKPADDDEDD